MRYCFGSWRRTHHVRKMAATIFPKAIPRTKSFAPLRVLQVSPSFHPAGHYGGPVYSGYRLCNGLVQLGGIELRVLTTDSDGPNRLSVHETPTSLPEGYDVFYCRRWLRPDIAPGMFLRLPSLVRWADVVHLTSVYSASTVPTLLLCRLHGKPVVWSTRGALQRWDGSTRARIKYVWEKVCDLLCDRQRVVIHVTSEAELSESLERIQNTDAVLFPMELICLMLFAMRGKAPERCVCFIWEDCTQSRESRTFCTRYRNHVGKLDFQSVDGANLITSITSARS